MYVQKTERDFFQRFLDNVFKCLDSLLDFLNQTCYIQWEHIGNLKKALVQTPDKLEFFPKSDKNDVLKK